MSDIDHLIPTSGLQGWYESDSIVGLVHGNNVTSWPDRSSHGRNLACSSDYPTFSENQLNGNPAVYFNGTREPLVWSGTATVRHAIVLASYSDATFPALSAAGEYAGLLSGIDDTSNVLFGGKPGSSQFGDNDYESLGTYIYKKRGFQYVEAAMDAPMSGAHSALEISLSSGWLLDGFQIGRDREHSTRKWKGRVFLVLLWNRVLSAHEVRDVYEYIATKYYHWQVSTGGLFVWPFQPNWSRPLENDKRVLESTSVSGAFKARTKSTRKKAIEPVFENRTPEEVDAAIAFWDAHYPGTSFIYRDEAFLPARESTMRFVSGIPTPANDTRDIDYSFRALEI